MTVVVVDDLRIFEFEATYLRTLEAALEWLDSRPGPVEALYLDHDLGGDEEDDVRPFVTRLEEMTLTEGPLPIERILIVSSNPDGRRYLVAALAHLYPVEDVADQIRFRVLPA